MSHAQNRANFAHTIHIATRPCGLSGSHLLLGPARPDLLQLTFLPCCRRCAGLLLRLICWEGDDVFRPSLLSPPLGGVGDGDGGKVLSF